MMAAAAFESTFVRPYAPAWFNQLNTWLEKLPGAVWMYWFAFALILFIIQTLIQWRDGTYPVGTFSAFHALLCFTASWTYGSGHYLNRVAARALVEFQPVMKDAAALNSQLHYRLTTQPRWPSMVATLAPMVFFIFYAMMISLPEVLRLINVSTSTLSAALNAVIYLVNLGAAGAGMYFSIHRLRTVSHIYITHTHFHLFELGPLYGLARVSAYTGILYLFYIYALYATAPTVFFNWLGYVLLLGLIGMAIFCLIWPVLGIHRLLLDEKMQQLFKNAQRLETTLEGLHNRLEAGELGDMDKLNNAIAALQLERKALQEVSTWPWSPETFRGIIAAVVLPLSLWGFQRVLERLMTP